MKTPKEKILLVGAGPMAQAYAAVLKKFKLSFLVIGRSATSAKTFEKATGVVVITGGLETFLKTDPFLPTKAIIAVSVQELGPVTRALLNAGVKNILVEKPGGLNKKDVAQSATLAAAKNAHVIVAYNRRFYESVRKARKMIMADDGVISCAFDFTERVGDVEKLKIPDTVKNEWLLANSSHVIDLAFHLAGSPSELKSSVGGALPWHKKAIFVGHGKTETGALFSYHANWLSGGRWNIEIVTLKRKLVLQPLETLRVMKKGTFDTKTVALDDSLDRAFKPGVYRETEAFLLGDYDTKNLLTLAEHHSRLEIYEAIANGRNLRKT
ncbi:MAG: hypothetical protein A3H68_03145 [Candidatus Taylorbacteria bacterium RIFCSPLOWO2_02_FULL_46_40]|uniref:Gfo/Idh/MocA-like oxidoreductase N-terminal domain-containing protein n=1 Tax=Candidatus Taylorbacteria bacterium RIFCSPLOWO2_02_FULL_46_40 TaxID=1802329 RepID=A0A1G2P154_9BACT|nr:MAG: hypothetical protein A3H68_03145 [Candidatus Taylorbacteria bacterium RIFCSPLOWO2_02_FULL_46_40]